VSTIVGAISALRGKVGGGKDQGVLRNGHVNITPTNGALPGGIPKKHVSAPLMTGAISL